MKLVSMKLSKEEREKNSMPTEVSADAPEYPYGMCLELDDEQLKKLGMSSLPEVDSEMMIEARVIVRRKSETSDKEGTDKCISLQITELGLGQAEQVSKAAKTLYGSETILTRE